MAKYEIQIMAENGVHENENIVEISICNGHWKYWDSFSETTEKVSLTINNMYDATYLNRPARDAITYFNQDELEKGNLVMEDAFLRTYETLLGYLNCRLENIKKQKYRKQWNTHILLFKKQYVSYKEEKIIDNIVYDEYCLVKVSIKRVD